MSSGLVQVVPSLDHQASSSQNIQSPRVKLLFLLSVLIAEFLGSNFWHVAFHSQPFTGFSAFISLWEGRLYSSVLIFAVAFGALLWFKSSQALRVAAREVGAAPIRWGLVVSNLFAYSGFLVFSYLLFVRATPLINPDIAVLIRLLLGIAAAIALGLSVVPVHVCRFVLRSGGFAWIYSAAAVLLTEFAGDTSRLLWKSSDRIAVVLVNITFFLVEKLLHLFVSSVVAIPAQKILGTTAFSVEIAPSCSGFEGLGLMLLFAIVWLTIFRREFAFPRALLLIPAGLATIFLLNTVRITALLLIGNAGFEQIAVGSFHSMAGWISFNFVAVAFVATAGRIQWIRKQREEETFTTGWLDSPTTAYLLPFLAIVAVGMLTGIVTPGFDWLYPAKFIAALAALWIFRRHYTSLDWSFKWLGPVIGVATFFIWIALSPRLNASQAMPASLASASALQRDSWIAIRVLASVLTVPIAEELAFRGFLLRRIVARDFELVNPKTYTGTALLVSSIAFGLLHQDHWLAGCLAGLLFGFVMVRSGKIGDAVAAHATTNLLLAGYVLAFGKWNLW